MKLALHLPINGVSFGQVSTLLLRTIFEQEQAGTVEHEWMLCPMFGQAEIGSQSGLHPEFAQWMQKKAVQFQEGYLREIPSLKLWHFNGSLETLSNNSVLFTFYELDSPTKLELMIARNWKMAFSSQYTRSIFAAYGIKSAFLPLAFDDFNFRRLDKKFFNDDRIVFNLCGKFEKRKHHAKVIQAWVKRFGGNKDFVLQCACYNSFFSRDKAECDKMNNMEAANVLQGPKPFNVSFVPHMRENIVYNEFLNSSNIIIGMSGGEGWGLPEFQSVAMGKHAVILNAHGYQSWATPETVTFVNPNGKLPAYDERFFRQGEPFNQGSIFDWDADEFVAACETAIAKVKANPINSEGLKLQETFSKDSFVRNVAQIIKSS